MPHTIDVPAVALTGNDLIVVDPDHPGVEVEWQITGFCADRLNDVVLADYRTADGTEGRHVWDHPGDMVTISARRIVSAPFGAAA
jgi:hypothetical protein